MKFKTTVDPWTTWGGGTDPSCRKEQISQDGVVRLSPHGLLLLCWFVNNDYVIAEIIYNAAHQEVLAWSRVTLCHMPVWAPPWKPCFHAAAASGLHWSGIMVMLYEVMLCLPYGHTMIMLWLLLRLLHQPGETLCYASQERITWLQFIPTAPQVFQPL